MKKDLRLATGLFILTVIGIGTFTQLTGGVDSWVRLLYFLLLSISVVYLPRRTTFFILFTVIFIEGSSLFLFNNPDKEDLIKHIAFSSTIILSTLILTFFFHRERKERDEALKDLQGLKAEAKPLNLLDGSEGRVVLEAISDKERLGHLVASRMEVEKDLSHLIQLIRKSLDAYSSCLFLPGEKGLSLKTFDSETPYILKDKRIETGKGYIGWIEKERRPLVVSEIKGGYNALTYYSKDVGIRSFLGVPILDTDLLEGVITVDSIKKGAFSQRQEEILKGFSIQVLETIKKARLDQQIDLSAKSIKALNEISEALSSTLRLREIGIRMVELSNLIVPYDQGALMLYDEKREELELVAARRWDGIKEGERFPVENCITGWIIRNRQPISFSDLKDRDDKIPIIPGTIIRARSFLGIPLLYSEKSEERAIGVFALSSQKPRSFTAYHHHLLSILCNQASVLISNARLHLEMEKMAITDGLTGLLNHRRFQERLTGEFSRLERHPEPLSLIIADIDHFKRINDTYGHPVGDEVLQTVAEILKGMVREIDIVARYGGEEFAIALINTEREWAYRTAERIRKAIEENTFTIKGRDIPVTLSLGISSYPHDGKLKEEIIAKADLALYRAKGDGRNRSSLS